MFPPLPEENARRYCRQLYMALEQGVPASDIRLDHEFPVLQKQKRPCGSCGIFRGGMFGVLVCFDDSGSETVLKGFSGKYCGLWIVPGWVPPLFDVQKFDSVLAEHDADIHRLTELLRQEKDPDCLTGIKNHRLRLTRESLDSIYSLYHFHCMDGTVATFRELGLKKKPPTGTGDCCGPKLLDFALRNQLHPVSMAEFYYGPPAGERISGMFYPPCESRCSLVLPYMLGLEILYRDEYIVVINKPAGLLSVPGRGEENQDCAVLRLRRLFPECIVQPAVHRLDQDTSGLIVFGLTTEAHRNLSIQFQKGCVRKKYIALLDGRLEESRGKAFSRGQVEGRIELPFRLDPDNRPFQVYDEHAGRMGITLWKKLKEQRMRQGDGTVVIRTRVEFTPLTGRTHQLRLAASDMHGLGLPVVGDRLYGTREHGERLMLHATYLEFTHPLSGRRMEFRCGPEF